MEALRSFFQTYTQLSKTQWLYWTLFYLTCWVLLAFTEAADMRAHSLEFQIWEPWVDQFAWVFCLGFLTPLVGYACRRWSESTFLTAIKLIAFYIPFKFIYISLVLMVKYLLYLLISHSPPVSVPLIDSYLYQILDASPIYVAAVFITYTKIYYDRVQREQLNAAKLESELQSVQMEVLRNQLQPHFLFNTLNLISSTMYRDVDKADSIVTRLGDLLRYSLATEHQPYVTLKEEMHVMASYLEIATLRFGDRLSTQVNIAPETESIMIPAMLLQPLLENAVKYGIEPSDEPGEVCLKSEIHDQQLVVAITNPWHQRRAQQESFGVGLKNTKNRLSLLYGELATVDLENHNNQSVTLTIRLPVQYLETL